MGDYLFQCISASEVKFGLFGLMVIYVLGTWKNIKFMAFFTNKIF